MCSTLLCGCKLMKKIANNILKKGVRYQMVIQAHKNKQTDINKKKNI